MLSRILIIEDEEAGFLAWRLWFLKMEIGITLTEG